MDLQAFINEAYFGLAQNFQKVGCFVFIWRFACDLQKAFLSRLD